VGVQDGVFSMTDSFGHSMNRLSSRKVSTIADKGRYADGGGLYLQVSGNGAKSWLFRYRRGLTSTGKPRIREMGLGGLNTFTLAESRQEAATCRKLLYENVDPIEHRQAKRNEQNLDAASEKTFKDCAVAYITAHQAAWKNQKHSAQWVSTFENHVFPTIGNLSIAAIDAGLVMRTLEPIWYTKTETASRVRGRIESVLDWAAVHGYRKGDNPARWKGHLDKLLPAKSKIAKVKHFPALPYTEIGSFIPTLQNRDGIAAIGLEFLILTAGRTGEVIGAKWDEFDGSVWTIPADRMKAKIEHRVPMSNQAVRCLERAKEVASSEYMFPGVRREKPMSNMAFLKLLQRMGHGDITAHGFRSTFRDWASEQTNFPREVAEMALAHTVVDKVEAAYRRGDLFEKRRLMMEAWAIYCSTPNEVTGKVVPIYSREKI